jgi:hypothetical protein
MRGRNQSWPIESMIGSRCYRPTRAGETGATGWQEAIVLGKSKKESINSCIVSDYLLLRIDDNSTGVCD